MIAPLRPTLMLGCALGALVLGARADAQAFNADPTTTAGVVTYDRATPGVETVTIDSPTAIINWIPNVSGNPIIFLPFGNTATFTNGISVTDFVVLNRIMANAPVRFDGHVISLIQDLAVGTSDIGGTVIFSSPTGIIIGPTAVFDIGNLVLTSLGVVDDGAGNFYDPAAQQLQFQLGGMPPSFVVTMAGAQINALNEGSYVAMVAPQIVHGGSIRVNGSAAFIAGEQVTMRVNQGLFDIIIDTGTDRVMPIIHTGSTTGPASTGAGDNHGIFLVAMPKNQAITAILQGNVGFDPAVDAAIENGVVVLSAGFNVVGGQVDRFGDFSPGPVPGIAANFEIRGGTITSDLFGFAVTDMLASGIATGNLAFSQDVSLFAGRRGHLFAGASQNVTVGGNALVSAAQTRSADPTLFDFTGGEALIFANQGGTLAITGNAFIDAEAIGRVDVGNSRAGNGTGGTAGLFADGGSITVGGSLAVRSNGAGAVIDFAPDQGGTGTGGSSLVEGRNGGSVAVGGTLTLTANGTASRQSGNVAGQGAPGIGGDISLAATGGGSVTVAGPTTLTSRGIGGQVLAGAGNVAGKGQGGTIDIRAGGTISLGGALGVTATGAGGEGPAGGGATGGIVTVEATNGQILLPGATAIDAGATGGIAQPGGAGGSATGGDVTLIARSGGNASLIRGGALNVSVAGLGGPGAAATGMAGGAGGDGRGGNVRMLAESGNGALQLGAVRVIATGTGGGGGESDLADQGGDGGDGFGGDVQLGTSAGPAVPTPAGSATFASVDAATTGTGGAGGAGGGAGGNGNGGRVALVATGATATITGAAMLNADATGGAGGAPGLGGGGTGAQGVADGGEIRLDAAASGTLAAGNVTGTASATGAPGTGNRPGEWHVTAGGGSAVNVQNLTLTAQASGTPTVRPPSSLEPMGGTINVAQIAQLTTLGGIQVIADGAGGIGGGTFSLDAGDDVTVSHSNRGANFTIDVAALDIQGDNVTAAEGSASRAAGPLGVAALGNVTVGGLLDGRDIAITGAAIDIAASGGVGSVAATDTVDIQVTGAGAVAGQVLGRDILLSAATIGIATGGAVGGAASDRAELRATGNATVDGSLLGRDLLVTAGSFDMGAAGAVGDATTDSVDIQVAGNVAVAGQILGGDILLAAATIGIATGGAVGGAASDRTELRSTGDATVDGAVLGRDVVITAAAFDVGGTGAIGDAATDSVDIQVAGNAAVAGQILGGDILLAAAAIGIGTTGVIGGAATDRAELRAVGNATVAGRVLGDTLLVRAGSVDVGGTGAIGDAATGSVDIQVTGNATVAGQILGQDILLSAAAIGVGGTGAIGGAATDRAELRATGNATVDGRVLGGDLLVTAGSFGVGAAGAVGDAATDTATIQVTGNATVAGQLLGRTITLNAAAIDVAASGVIGGAATDLADLRALGQLGVAGRLLGRTIRLASADIDIAATGAVGDAGTQLVELLPGNSGQMAVLGGTAQGPGYTLTNAEAGRIRAGTLRLVAPPVAGGTALLVRDLTVNGGGAAAGIGLLDLVTQGIARVEGALLMANAAAGNGIAITARQRLEVVTPTASIRVQSAAGAPGGTLALTSDNIWIASQAIIDQLRQDPNYAGRDADLIDNDGVDAPRGYVEANGVTLTTGGTLFVQNSTGATGAFLTGTDFGAITVGPGGLTIQSTATPARVTAFGRRLNADGSFTTGDDFFFTANFAAGGAALVNGYTGGSTLNTCIIVTGQCPARLPPDTGPSGRDPTIGPTGGAAAIPLAGTDDDDLVDSSFARDPLIEEPVTSGGESTLWECDRDQDGDCDDQDH